MAEAGQTGDARSLAEVHSSVGTGHPGFWKRMFAFAGPAYLVSVGYMDPGNWATDIEAGSRFGYGLLFVVLPASPAAVLLPTLCGALGLVTQKDVARACREHYSPRANRLFWLGAELAIVACDLAEVL